MIYCNHRTAKYCLIYSVCVIRITTKLPEIAQDKFPESKPGHIIIVHYHREIHPKQLRKHTIHRFERYDRVGKLQVETHLKLLENRWTRIAFKRKWRRHDFDHRLCDGEYTVKMWRDERYWGARFTNREPSAHFKSAVTSFLSNVTSENEGNFYTLFQNVLPHQHLPSFNITYKNDFSITSVVQIIILTLPHRKCNLGRGIFRTQVILNGWPHKITYWPQ